MTESTSAIVSGIRELGAATDAYGTTLNTQVSPAAADLIGRVLADAVRDLAPDHIAVWESSDEAVLAHIVALATGATVLRVTDESGITSVTPSITPATGSCRWRPPGSRAGSRPCSACCAAPPPK